MSKSSTSFNSLFFLQISLGLMFIAFGVLALTNYNSELAQLGRSVNSMLGGSNKLFPVIFAVIELLAGVLLLVSVFASFPGKLLPISLLVIFIFWAINIVMSYIMEGFLEPSFFVWLSRISPQLVVLSALWLVYRGQE